MSIQSQIKAALFQHCQTYVDERIDRIKTAIQTAQNAANEESKSSMGDKYETTRAMMHLEKEKLMGQLQEAAQLKKTLAQITPKVSTIIQLGSLVKTQAGTYYLAVSIGKVQLDGTAYFVISPASPIGKALLGKQMNDEVNFNGRKLIIQAVD
ncbi:MAG: GreA/GreB family elongation factor [Flammeovirgaceae bacterium]